MIFKDSLCGKNFYPSVWGSFSPSESPKLQITHYFSLPNHCIDYTLGVGFCVAAGFLLWKEESPDPFLF